MAEMRSKAVLVLLLKAYACTGEEIKTTWVFDTIANEKAFKQICLKAFCF